MDRRKQFSLKTLSVFALMDAEGNGINSSLYKEKIKIQENENPPNAFPITPFHLCFFIYFYNKHTIPHFVVVSGDCIFD